MSATNRGTERDEHDHYPTPGWCIQAIAKHINWTKVKTAHEPCIASGSIPLNCPPGVQWTGSEIRHGKDYLTNEVGRVDLILTNPPYDLAQEFITKSLQEAACVVYLLRINFLGTEKRRQWLSQNPPTHLYTLSERPSFVDVCDGQAKTKTRERVKGCGAIYQKTEGVKVCPKCGGHVKAGTDATEYAWFVWDSEKSKMWDPPGFYFIGRPD